MLTDLKVDKDDRGLYLSAECIFKDGYHTKKLTIPKIRLDCVNYIPSFLNTAEDIIMQVDYTRLPLECGDDGQYFTVETIEQGPRKMTLSEIERELGYKVDIIGE